MTIVLAIHLPGFVVIGADSRGTNFVAGAVDDTVEKVALTTEGLISAAGSYGLFELVSEDIQMNGAPASDLPEIIAAKRSMTQGLLGFDGAQAITSFVQSHVSESGELILEEHHPSREYAPRGIPPGGFHLIAPLGMTGEVEVELRRQITQRIQDLPPTGTFAERTLGVQRIIQSVVQATAIR